MGNGTRVGEGVAAPLSGFALGSLGADSLEDGAAALDCVRASALRQASMFDVGEAAAFAGTVEDIARTVEYLQIVAAQAVERTRGECASGKAPAWRAGWTEREDAAQGGGASTAAVLDDGYRNAAEFLRASLRITIKDARSRLALASTVLPGTGMTGEQLPPRREELAAAAADALVSARSATLIGAALDDVQLLTDAGTITKMEHALTATALESDPDFVARAARRWIAFIDQDGHEPSEEALRQIQGAFIRKPRHGLQHLEIFATAEQFETLTTVMNAATNPRLTSKEPASPFSSGKSSSRYSGMGSAAGWVPELDRRSRAQKLLDGLVGGCKHALATGKLPANGGLKPQVMVTIDYRDLFNGLKGQDSTGSTQVRLSSAASTFQGPIHPNIIRKIACDADILPVLLGSEGRVLGIGRTSRIFPPHIRKALNARDQGCAFPDCTMPTPWCEAHHITYWSQGGPTSTDNGVLLCSHHHQVIHKEQWKIASRNGVPWFTPPPHVDPSQTARRNHHHTPLRT
ncbi:HNH endonuclease signature motif containing protein [Paenarthrobacter nitroguajacolicus]|uniref:HNH endonuclease signature motif containing protein n=1 Tax=Paenarthrobacter nitroguajacolicus TaxID=211146 RepID=UPI00248BB8E4|nr:HNH endonuclease signature motif containing protein [Paenarthrobacter nitroguajacolicus]MDI2034316.1 hypothetical protein [Paenarthrobacter nitroguajacolicus]